ncbi:MAG TPA: heme-binding protein [Actinomycetota bacterium]
MRVLQAAVDRAAALDTPQCVVVDGQVLGAVGVSSGSGEEDLEVARAGVAAIPGARTDW